MKFGKYIHDLLLSNETVIIPGFGAFVSEYKPAEITESEIIPPSKKIAFTANIRNNDGLLVDYVAKKEQVSHFDALKIIEKERDNISFLLDKGVEVELDKVGKLSVEDDGDIKFVPIDNENLSVETFGLEAVSIDKLNEFEEETEEPGVAAFEEPVVETNEAATDVEPTTTEPEVTTEVEFVQEETDIETTDQTEEEEQPEIEEPDVPDSKEPVIDPIFNTIKKAELVEPEEKKKKAGWYWYLFILIPIIIAGVFVVKKTTNDKSVPEKSEVSIIEQPKSGVIADKEDPVVAIDTFEIAQDATTSTDTVETQLVDETQLGQGTSQTQPVFYLIGGSFELEENARTYMEELEEKGFEPFFMGKRGKFYMIGVGKYETEGQAFRARQVMWETNPNAGLWIMEE